MNNTELFGILVMGWMAVGISISYICHKFKDIVCREIKDFIRDW